MVFKKPFPTRCLLFNWMHNSDKLHELLTSAVKLCHLTFCFITRKNIIILDISRCSHLKKWHVCIVFTTHNWNCCGLSRY